MNQTAIAAAVTGTASALPDSIGKSPATPYTPTSVTEFFAKLEQGPCWMKILPELAAELLAQHNNRNRGFRTPNLKTISEIISKGEFVPNGEAMVFYADQNAADCQHRLKGCADTGIPIISVVVGGVALTAAGTYDVGAARTKGDTAALEHVPHADIVGNAIGLWWKLAHNGVPSGKGPTNVQVKHVVQSNGASWGAHAGKADEVVGQYNTPMLPAATITALRYFAEKKGLALGKFDAFIDVVVGGTGEALIGDPCLPMLQQVFTMLERSKAAPKGSKARLRLAQQLALVDEAFGHFLAGTPTAKLGNRKRKADEKLMPTFFV